MVTRIGDNFTEALTLWTRTGRHHIAKERALYFLNFTGATTASTGHWFRLGCGTGTGATVTQHRGIHGDGLAHTGVRLFQRNAGAQQRIIARLHTGAWATALAAAGAAEELSEDIAQATAAEATTKAAGATAALLLHWVRSHVNYAALLRIQKNFLR